jgi:hypothetical protein
MNMALSVRLLSSIVLVLFGNSVIADVWDKWDAHFDENLDNEGVEEFVWKEDSSNLPQYPLEKNLLPIDGPPTHRDFSYFIDETSITIGHDRVVRYSLVIRSKSGSDNVVYDGIRCTDQYLKNYAYGAVDKTGKKIYMPREKPQWKPLQNSGMTAYGPVLATNYFCSRYDLSLKLHEIINNIKYGESTSEELYY